MQDTRQLHGGELAVVVMEQIEGNLDRWRQSSWRVELNGQPIELYLDDPTNPSCTTAFCFAGWVAALDRVKWCQARPEAWIGNPEVCDCPGPFCTDLMDHGIDVSRYAARRLGLDIQEAEDDLMFAAANSLEELQLMTQRLVAGLPLAEPSDEYEYDDDEDEPAEVDDDDTAQEGVLDDTGEPDEDQP